MSSSPPGGEAAGTPGIDAVEHDQGAAGSEEGHPNSVDLQAGTGVGKQVAGISLLEAAAQLQVVLRFVRPEAASLCSAPGGLDHLGLIDQRPHLQFVDALQQAGEMVGMRVRDHDHVEPAHSQSGQLSSQAATRRAAVEEESVAVGRPDQDRVALPYVQHSDLDLVRPPPAASATAIVR